MSNVLTYPGGKLRLCVEAPLAEGAEIEPSAAQVHYLLHVMRAQHGDRVSLFNGRDGEWVAHIVNQSRRQCTLMCVRRVGPQIGVPDIWFAFAPIKKTAAEFVVQKATELGAQRLIPVITNRTIVRRVNRERLYANAVEAAEQSGRREVPEITEAVSLETLLAQWPAERRLLFCDEGGDSPAIAEALWEVAPAPWGLLIGPEGGFDAEERAAIRAHPMVLPVTLGRRILRADTAGLAALAVWQALVGDWPE